MGAVIKKEFWTVEKILRFVDEKIKRNAFYPWGLEEGASKREVIDKMVDEASNLGYNESVINCVFNGYPLPNIVICRARLHPDGEFSEDIGDDVWVLCSGQLVLDTLYAYREGLTEDWGDKCHLDGDRFSYWNGESYQMMAYKASMGDKEAKKRFDDFNSCEIPFIRILEIDEVDDIFEINEVLDCCAD